MQGTAIDGLETQICPGDFLSGWFKAVREQEHATTCACQRNVEKAALLDILKHFRLRYDQVEQLVVLDLAWHPVITFADIKQDRIVGFSPLCPACTTIGAPCRTSG